MMQAKEASSNLPEKGFPLTCKGNLVHSNDNVNVCDYSVNLLPNKVAVHC